MRLRQLYPLLLALLLASAATVISLRLYRPPGVIGNLLWRMELGSYDWRLSLRPSHFPSSIVIVAIDNESLQQRPMWPWPRGWHGELISRLTRAGARLIGMDIIFSDASPSPKDDAALGKAIAESGRVVLAGQLTGDEAARGENLAAGVSSAMFPCEPFASAMRGLGLTNVLRDPDSVVRRVWLQRTHQDESYYTLPVMLAALYQKRPPERVAAEALAAAGSAHEFLGGDTMLVNFCGPAGTIKAVPYYQVLEGLVDPAIFRDKIVLVGGSAEVLQDVYPTPMARRSLSAANQAQLAAMPGVEVQANTLATLLGRAFIRPLPLDHLTIATFLIALIICLATLLLRPLRAGLLSLVLLGAVTLAGLIAMWRYNLWVPLVPVLLVGCLAYLEGTVYMYFTVERARQRLRRAWQQRVSAEVLQIILNNPVPKVVGRRIIATVMFTDLRGFTTMCHTCAPEQVVERLNEYLTAMTEVIRADGGTIHKFIGDGIMAVFGDPVAHPDHADRAVRTAIEMQRRMVALNEASRSRGLPPMYMGAGIHSGELVAGDIGSEQLLEYTVIGDTVSTSSRIEGLNKDFHTGILFSGQTRELLTDPGIQSRHVGTQAVRGRAETLELYTVDLPEMQLPPEFSEKKDAS